MSFPLVEGFYSVELRRDKIRIIIEQKYSRSKAEGYRMITGTVEIWRREQKGKNEGESKRIQSKPERL